MLFRKFGVKTLLDESKVSETLLVMMKNPLNNNQCIKIQVIRKILPYNLEILYVCFMKILS